MPLHRFALLRSKKYLTEQYGADFYGAFRSESTRLLQELLPKVPRIGKSIFSSSYEFGPPYIAWYKTLEGMGLSQNNIQTEIWKMNELLFTAVPPFLRPVCGRVYFSAFRRKAEEYLKRQQVGTLHPFDWRISYREIDGDTFAIDIYTCGLKRLAEEFGAEQLLPTICRMDYLFANLLHNGFERTKTLGDGHDCCNCRYTISGYCEWAPEKGFENRK